MGANPSFCLGWEFREGTSTKVTFFGQSEWSETVPTPKDESILI